MTKICYLILYFLCEVHEKKTPIKPKATLKKTLCFLCVGVAIFANLFIRTSLYKNITMLLNNI